MQQGASQPTRHELRNLQGEQRYLRTIRSKLANVAMQIICEEELQKAIRKCPKSETHPLVLWLPNGTYEPQDAAAKIGSLQRNVTQKLEEIHTLLNACTNFTNFQTTVTRLCWWYHLLKTKHLDKSQQKPSEATYHNYYQYIEQFPWGTTLKTFFPSQSPLASLYATLKRFSQSEEEQRSAEEFLAIAKECIKRCRSQLKRAGDKLQQIVCLYVIQECQHFLYQNGDTALSTLCQTAYRLCKKLLAFTESQDELRFSLTPTEAPKTRAQLLKYLLPPTTSETAEPTPDTRTQQEQEIEMLWQLMNNLYCILDGTCVVLPGTNTGSIRLVPRKTAFSAWHEALNVLCKKIDTRKEEFPLTAKQCGLLGKVYREKANYAKYLQQPVDRWHAQAAQYYAAGIGQYPLAALEQAATEEFHHLASIPGYKPGKLNHRNFRRLVKQYRKLQQDKANPEKERRFREIFAEVAVLGHQSLSHARAALAHIGFNFHIASNEIDAAVDYANLFFKQLEEKPLAPDHGKTQKATSGWRHLIRWLRKPHPTDKAVATTTEPEPETEGEYANIGAAAEPESEDDGEFVAIDTAPIASEGPRTEGGLVTADEASGNPDYEESASAAISLLPTSRRTIGGFFAKLFRKAPTSNTSSTAVTIAFLNTAGKEEHVEFDEPAIIPAAGIQDGEEDSDSLLEPL